VYDVFQHVALCCRQSQLHGKGESIFVFEQSNGVWHHVHFINVSNLNIFTANVIMNLTSLKLDYKKHQFSNIVFINLLLSYIIVYL